MDDKLLEKFKILLLAKQVEINECLKTLLDSAQPVDLDTPIGRISRMDAISQQQLQLESKRKMELTLKKIDSALKRISEGTYGECTECEEQISENRLLATSWALMCISCQEGSEK